MKKSIMSKTSAMCTRLKVGPMKRLYKYYTPGAVNFAGMAHILIIDCLKIVLCRGCTNGLFISIAKNECGLINW
jgi:hypothetical protein